MRHPPALDLNPLVDVMTTLMVLLMAFGVASEVASLPVDRQLRDGPCFPPPPLFYVPPPLTLHLHEDGVWIGRHVRGGTRVPRDADGFDLRVVKALVAFDRQTWPGERDVILVTDDGEAYHEFVSLLDLTKGYGYDRPLLGGGPPAPPITFPR